MRWASWALGAGAAAAGYLLLRPRLKVWGTRPVERAGPYPGDEVVGRPNYQSLLGVEVDAPPEALWPWLMQLGRGRGGLYSYDWLDRLFGYLDRPSARALLPGRRELQPGDLIPVGKDPRRYFPVRRVEPNRALVIGIEDPRAGWRWSWAFLLVPEGRRTRLLSRSRSYVPLRPRALLMWALLELPSFLMTRKMLLNLRDRAEGLARSPGWAPAAAAP